jgi:hypothetical protein
MGLSANVNAVLILNRFGACRNWLGGHSVTTCLGGLGDNGLGGLSSVLNMGASGALWCLTLSTNRGLRGNLRFSRCLLTSTY